MTLLTKQEIEALLNGGIVGQCDLRDHAGDLARTALDALAQLADAEAAQALVVERAAKELDERGQREQKDFGLDRATQNFYRARDIVRALADPSGVAALAALRAERDAALAEVARVQEDRAYVIGANDGWDAAVEQGEASPAIGKAMVRFWRRMAEMHNNRAEKAEAERDDLRARLAAAEAQVGALTTALNEIDALDPEGMIDGCAQTALRGLVLRMGEIARAALATVTPPADTGEGRT